MKVLFLSYGIGPHQAEVEFAIHCLKVHAPEITATDVLVYTDTPNRFPTLPAVIHTVSSDQWQEWAGPKQFNHRRKILALDHALDANNQPILLLDGDTWLRGPLRILQSRIGPGRGLMHIREGQICRLRTQHFDSIRKLLLSPQGQQTNIPVEAWMWNAGAVGLHPNDRHLLQKVLSLTDLLCELSTLHISEQLAFSWILSQHIHLQAASDIIFHYWPPYLHKPFREKLSAIFKDADLLHDSQKARFFYSHRPRPSTADRCKTICKRIMVNLRLRDEYCRTNEW